MILNHKDTKSTKNVNEEEREELEGLAHEVIGASIEVHRLLGPGYLETIYEEALSLELARRGVPFARQVTLTIMYKGQAIGESRLDLLIGGKLIVELNAVEALAPIHTAQALSYLKATGHRLALLINFNVPILKEGVRRIIR